MSAKTASDVRAKPNFVCYNHARIHYEGGEICTSPTNIRCIKQLLVLKWELVRQIELVAQGNELLLD